MLTVKVIDPSGESIYQSKHVDARNSASMNPPVVGNVYFQTDDGAEIEIEGSGATIYVMNDNGKTVAIYHLGGLPPIEDGSN